MKVKIKKLHPKAVIPKYAQKGDAGLDLTATSLTYDDHGNAVYCIGLAIEIPEGYVGYIFPRSSISKKTLMLTNKVGVIDSNYRGEIMLKFKPNMSCFGINPDNLQTLEQSEWVEINDYEVGERIGQLIIMPLPTVELVEVDELSDTNRGAGGFGSTGN
jgi:dUTP pyrophosphatase